MTTRFAARATALGLSALVTLAMLGSVNYLATFDAQPAAMMAGASQHRG